MKNNTAHAPADRTEHRHTQSRSGFRRRSPVSGWLLGVGAVVAASAATIVAVGPVAAAPTPAPTFEDGVLTINGDSASNSLNVGRTMAGAITVNGVVILGGQATVDNVAVIGMDGGEGNDTLRIDETNGPMPPAKLVGGVGNDKLTGGSADDIIDGADGADSIDGGAGGDRIDGGAGNDKVVGGPGNDTVNLGADSDEFTWNTGQGDDVKVDGDADKDTLHVVGTDGDDFLSGFTNINDDSEAFLALRKLPADQELMSFAGFEFMKIDLGAGADTASIADYSTVGMSLVRVNVDPATGSDGARDGVAIAGNFFRHYRIRIIGTATTGVSVGGFGTTGVIIGGAESLTVNGGVGPDVIDASRLAAGVLDLTEFGFNGDDILVGSPGNDRLFGAEGNDRIECRGGTDFLGATDPGDTIVC